MPLLSVAAKNASLDNDYGASHGPNAPASFELALFNGDPSLGGVEMDRDGAPIQASLGGGLVAGGYAPVAMGNDGTNFPAADGGQKVCAEVSFPTPTGPWYAGGVPDTATFWALRDPSTGTVWDYDALSGEVDIEEAGGSVSVQPVIYYGGQTEDFS